MSHWSRTFLAACMALALATAAHAQQADIGLNLQDINLGANGRPLFAQPGLAFDVGVLESDNVFRVPDSPTSGQVGALGATLDLAHTGPRLSYDLTGDLQVTDYFKNQYPTKLLGFFDGSGLFQIVPNIFEWTARETFNQLTADPFAAPTPNRVTAVNDFSTGPRLLLPLGLQTSLALSGEYGRTNTGFANQTANVGNVDLNSDHYSGAVTLQQSLSKATSLSLNGTAERVEFDNTQINTDYDLDTAYLAYSTKTERMSFLLQGGYDQVRVAGQTYGGPGARLAVVRQITPSSTLALTLSQAIENALDQGHLAARSLTGALLDVIAQPEPIRNRTAGLAWTYNRERNTFILNGNYIREQSDFDPTFDRSAWNAGAYYLRHLFPNVSMQVQLNYLHEDFPVIGIHDQEYDSGIGVAYQPALRETFTLRYDRFDRASSDPTASFRESRIGLTFVYRVL